MQRPTVQRPTVQRSLYVGLGVYVLVNVFHFFHLLIPKDCLMCYRLP